MGYCQRWIPRKVCNSAMLVYNVLTDLLATIGACRVAVQRYVQGFQAPTHAWIVHKLFTESTLKSKTNDA